MPRRYKAHKNYPDHSKGKLKQKGWQLDNNNRFALTYHCQKRETKQALKILKIILRRNLRNYEEWFYFKKCFIFVCEYDHIELAKLLYRESHFEDKDTYSNLLEKCSKKGCTRVIEYLFTVEEFVPSNLDECFNIACEKGNLETAKIFYEKGCININRDKALKLSCKYGRKNVVEWLCSLDFKVGFIDGANLVECFEVACYHDELAIVNSLYSCKQRHFEKEELNINKMLRQSCKKNHLNMVEWLCSKTDLKIDIDGVIRCFQESCLMGNLAIAKFLYQNFCIDKDKALLLSCQYPHKNMVEWLCCLPDFKVTNLVECFEMACHHNELPIVNTLYDYKQQYYKEEEMNIDQIIRQSCKNYHINMIEWLCSKSDFKSDTDIIINAITECFQDCCIMGHLDSVKRLYNLGIINVRANNDKAFRACYQTHVLEWLSELVDCYCFGEGKYFVKVNPDMLQVFSGQLFSEDCGICNNEVEIAFSCGHGICKNCYIEAEELYPNYTKDCYCCRENINGLYRVSS